MGKSYKAPKLSVAGDQIYESIPGGEAGVAAAEPVTQSAAACFTACSSAPHIIDVEITAERSLLNIRPLTKLEMERAAEKATRIKKPAPPAKSGTHT